MKMTIKVTVYGAKKTANYFNRLSRETKRASAKGNLRVARSVQMFARNILDRETIKHTGELWQDVRIHKMGGKNNIRYDVIAGQYAPYAWLIEKGRKAMPNRKFVKTQEFPLEGFSVPSPSHSIRAYKGIKYMERATDKARTKAKQVMEEEIRKVIR